MLQVDSLPDYFLNGIKTQRLTARTEPGPDRVVVAMETLAWCWPCDPRGGQREPWATWGVPPVLPPPPPLPPPMWAEPLSPHLLRNKQLQDVLLQREEELARLQEENHKLRRFLGSSFVRNLEQTAKNVAADSRNLKRNLEDETQRTFQNLKVSKKFCRNLSAQIHSESLEPLEPNLDLWVLRTLGLKDRDTIDTSRTGAESSCPGFPFASPVCSTPSSIPVPAGLLDPQCQTTVSLPRCSGCVENSFGPSSTEIPGSVVFRMSLSPSSSVKTHSFPQGQAFTRRDRDGTWSFTWVPKQGPM